MKTEDVEITVKDCQPKGGQQVGVMNHTIVVRHIPTGIYAACGTERSNMKNRNIAMSMLEWGLAEIGWED